MAQLLDDLAYPIELLVRHSLSNDAFQPGRSVTFSWIIKEAILESSLLSLIVELVRKEPLHGRIHLLSI